MYQTWRAAATAINAIIPDMSVSVADTGEGTVMPWWLQKLSLASLDIEEDTIQWMKESKTLFYAWHWYGSPNNPETAIKNAQEKGNEWKMPTWCTESMSCDVWNACDKANISHSYWHYSAYCDTSAAYFGYKKVPEDTFGACILGWAAGDSQYKCEA